MWMQIALIVGAVIGGNVLFLLMLGHRTPAKWAAAAYLKIREEADKIKARQQLRRTKAMIGLFVWAALSSASFAQGFASAKDLNVMASTTAEAADIKSLAQRQLEEIAAEWLNGEIPDRMICIHLDKRTIPACLTCAPAGETRHYIWVQDRSQLKHELAHALLWHLNLPEWADEGIASQYDNYPSDERRLVSYLISAQGKHAFLKELKDADNQHRR